MRSRKPRLLVNRKVTAVLSETTETETRSSRGMPKHVLMLVSVYRLECGHSTSRTWKRNRPATEVGSRMKCETCTNAAVEQSTEAARASA